MRQIGGDAIEDVPLGSEPTMTRFKQTGLRQVVHAVDAIHVAGGDRVDGGQIARRTHSRESNHRWRAAVASGQATPLDELTETTAPSGMSLAASPSEISLLAIIHFLSRIASVSIDDTSTLSNLRANLKK